MINKLKPTWISEFKKFALKGNVVDMAVGVIIGGAFGKIVTKECAEEIVAERIEEVLIAVVRYMVVVSVRNNTEHNLRLLIDVGPMILVDGIISFRQCYYTSKVKDSQFHI